MTFPAVNIVVADNAANAPITLPQSNVQAVIGCAVSTATVSNNVPLATTNPNTIQTSFAGGPLVEAAGLVCAAGGTVIAVSCPIVTPGTATAVTATVTTSTSTITVTLDGTNGAWDTYYVMMKCIASGTVGAAGMSVQISLDAGRTFGGTLFLGTANTLAIPNTGITLNFGAGRLTAGDYWRFSTTAPAPNDAGISAAITALANSAYGVAGWGSMHIVGTLSAATVTNIQAYLTTLTTTNFIFTRALTEARDAIAPVAWGGTGETESAWGTSLTTAFGSTSAKRVSVGAGYYNMPSTYPNSYAGTPSYRRPLTWADAVRRVLVQPQRRGGRVKDGSLSNIVVNPASDPGDGFIYHDETNNPVFDAARFMSAKTWPKKTGFFIVHENLMAPNGSQFTDLVLGNVIDVASDIAYVEGVNEISDDLTLTDTGTLAPTDALGLQNTIAGAIKTNMTDVAMISGATVAVSQTQNVLATSTIPITISILPRGYVDVITETINLGVPSA
jgi:hypothetical protein